MSWHITGCNAGRCWKFDVFVVHERFADLCYYYRANIFGLINGGTAGLIWVYIGTFFGFLCAVISMAEMASM